MQTLHAQSTAKHWSSFPIMTWTPVITAGACAHAVTSDSMIVAQWLDVKCIHFQHWRLNTTAHKHKHNTHMHICTRTHTHTTDTYCTHTYTNWSELHIVKV